MKNIYKIFAVVAIAGFLFVLLPVKDSLAAAGDCTANAQLNSVKNPTSFNQPVIFSSTISLSNFINGGADDGYCRFSSVVGSYTFRTIYIYYDFGSGPPSLSNIPPTSIVGSKFKVSTVNLAKNNPAINDSVSITPLDFGFKDGDTMNVKIYAMGCGSLLLQSACNWLGISSVQSVKLAAGTYKIFACVAGNGNYACSAEGKNYSDCSGVPNKSSVCGTNPCDNIDSNLCGKPAQNTHKGCLNNSCTTVPGAGSDTCTTNANCVAGGGGGSSTNVFNLPNPIGVENFQDLINIIGKWIFNLAIPIAVIIIIYAGMLMLTAGGVPAKFQKGAKALWYAVLGLAVVLIGKGFVTLIQSILSLKNK